MTEIAFRLNTTTSRALPRGKTPFDIWFGRQRRCIQQVQLSDNETEVEDMEEGEGEDDTAELEDIEGAEDVEEPLENTELGELAEVEEEEVADRQDIHSEMSDLCFYAEDEMPQKRRTTMSRQRITAQKSALLQVSLAAPIPRNLSRI